MKTVISLEIEAPGTVDIEATIQDMIEAWRHTSPPPGIKVRVIVVTQEDE